LGMADPAPALCDIIFCQGNGHYVENNSQLLILF